MENEAKEEITLAFGLASLHFWHLFLNQKLRLGAGVAARFAKAPVGIWISLSETKGFSAKGGGRPPASALRPAPWKDRRLGFAKRDAAPAPWGPLESLDLPIFY